MENNAATAANRQHKDTVFRDLFGAEERKGYALSLYNALTGSNHTDVSVLQITTLSDVLYMNVKNDVSILIDSRMMLWEHQSTRNPNMPLRGLVYLAQLYQTFTHKHKLSLYGGKRLTLPTPYYCIFYNGTDDVADRQILRLSDSFGEKEPPRGLLPAVEVTAVVLNINAGHNNELMHACQTLADYAHFMSLIRSYNMRMPLAEAIDVAMRQCIKEGVLADYLSSKRAEVMAMLITEFDQAEYEQIVEREKREIAEEARAEGQRAVLAKLVRDGGLSPEQAAELLGIDVGELRELMQ